MIRYRVFLAPWVRRKTDDGWVQYSKVEEYELFGSCTTFPVKADGSPASPFVLTIAWGEEWAKLDADPEIFDLFDDGIAKGMIPVIGQQELAAHLGSKTLDGFTLDQQNRIRDKLIGLGVDVSPLKGSMSWKQLLAYLDGFLKANDGRV